MSLINEILANPPDIANSQGEEIWSDIGRNLALVRLKPQKSSQLHFHKETKEWYRIVWGQATVFLNGVKFTLNPPKQIEIDPGVKHQVLNEGLEDVIFLAQTDRRWDLSDQFLVPQPTH